MCLVSRVRAVLYKTEPQPVGLALIPEWNFGTPGGVRPAGWNRIQAIFVLIFLNFKLKNILPKGVKDCSQTRNGQICLHLRNDFGQLKIQVLLPGGEPPTSMLFMLSCY